MLQSLAQQIAHEVKNKRVNFAVRWHVAFQHPNQFDLCGAFKMNEMVDLIPAEDWVWVLDDDNEVHPDFFTELAWHFDLYTAKQAFVFSQNRWDVLGPVLEAKPENMKVGGVDTAQVVFQKKLRGDLKLDVSSRVCDGILYAEMYRRNPDAFYFSKAVIVNFNAAKRPKE